MIKVNLHHDCTTFFALRYSGYAIINISSLNTGKRYEISVLERFIDKVIRFFKWKDMFEIKKISLPVPLGEFRMFLVEYGAIFWGYFEFKLPLDDRWIPVFVHLHILKYS